MCEGFPAGPVPLAASAGKVCSTNEEIQKTAGTALLETNKSILFVTITDIRIRRDTRIFCLNDTSDPRWTGQPGLILLLLRTARLVLLVLRHDRPDWFPGQKFSGRKTYHIYESVSQITNLTPEQD
ncbi:hypothetical protein PoB_002622600 [Plakobranchus ocellatus]|uniref:Uncharacterized protein n=1 Tax=Plakobranchus ocellatus TaxID=259542 RepID=A0AAV3ZUU9_9GAST|nr:hypothetical protein PoB_002622600 [Plakobranchus ocellatus]